MDSFLFIILKSHGFIFIDTALYSSRVSSEDYGVVGLRYGSGNLSMGATLMPFSGKSPHYALI